MLGFVYQYLKLNETYKNFGGKNNSYLVISFLLKISSR
jgi:hypothetical protein